jgi:transcriptional regulator with XRE-family HTH domain
MTNIENLAKIIRERRSALKYTQADIAELTGLTDRTIRSMENAQGNTTLQSLLRVLNILGLEIKLQFKHTNNEAGERLL